MSINKGILQNRYQIERQIGIGGMGAVYLGVDRRFGSLVAIKESIVPDSARLNRAFEHEAQLLNSLRHPALPHVIDYFAEGNQQFIVMEYIAGEDLSEVIERQGSFAVTDVLRWTDDLLDALDYLHTQKFPVIHRDIKPQNLKLTPDSKIILLDFGLAKGNPAELSQLTITKSIFGYSRIYAPLEQIQGTGTDHRSDLYSLAATVYHLLTGEPPVDALTRAKSILSDESDLLKPINSLNSQVPVAVAKVLQIALSLNANIRPQSAALMRSALKDAALQIQKSNSDKRILKQMRGESSTKNGGHTLVASTNSLDKLKIQNDQSDKKSAQPIAANINSSFRPSFRTSLKIAASILLTCGAVTYGILSSRPASFEKASSNNSQTEINAQTVGDQNVLPPKAVESAADIQTISQNAAAINPAKNAAAQTKISSPPIVFNKSTKIKIIQNKPALKTQTLVKQKTINSVNLNEFVQKSKETFAQKLEKTEQKKTGLKGLFNKIGAGAMRLPKAIFKKKKD